jgi:hypothetical protein
VFADTSFAVLLIPVITGLLSDLGQMPVWLVYPEQWILPLWSGFPGARTNFRD